MWVWNFLILIAKRNNFYEIKRSSNVKIFNFVRCGEGGIRTRDNLAIIHAFQACALVRYATPPLETVNKFMNLLFLKSA